MKKGRIVVRIEISTLLDGNGKLSHRKMDRLAMVLTNLQNSGKDLLLVSSGAIVLGTDKLNVKIDMTDITGMMAAAAIGQAELISLYQKYFDQYNQKVAQVLLTTDIMDRPSRISNTQNTFDKLLEMGLIPIINENDTVSTSDIELDDNYPLALNVAMIAKADMILIKSDLNSNYIIQPRNSMKAIMVSSEQELFSKLDEMCVLLKDDNKQDFVFPKSICDLVFEN
jgi:glutamate 5-kinase